MNRPAPTRLSAVLAWLLLAAAVVVPVGLAAASPLQSSRDALWIVGGMAGVVALALLLIQPMLAAGLLPGPSVPIARRWHRWIGATIIVGVLLHLGGLYLSSPSDITDALLLISPTPFAVYGVLGLAGVIVTAALVAARTRTGLRYGTWRILHNTVSVVVVVASIAHAMLIEGVMDLTSKTVLCNLVAAATVVGLVRVYWRK